MLEKWKIFVTCYKPPK